MFMLNFMGQSVLNVRRKFKYRSVTPESAYIWIQIQDLHSCWWQSHDITDCTELHCLAFQLYYRHLLLSSDSTEPKTSPHFIV